MILVVFNTQEKGLIRLQHLLKKYSLGEKHGKI